MKTRIRYIIVLTLCSITITTQSQWEWINPTPQGNSVLNLYYLDENTGFVVGNHGTIMKTTDGGESWVLQNFNTELNFCSVHFVNHETGFVVGGNRYSDDGTAVVLKTIDSGNNWNIVYQDSIGSFYGVYCVTSDSVFVSGKNGILLRSSNGGADWDVLNSGIDDIILQVVFPTAMTGYAISLFGTMIKTEDGGTNWEELDLGTPPTAWLISVSFPEPQLGYVLVYDNGPGYVLKTPNGGDNWITVLNPTPTPSSLDFISSDVGYVSAAGLDYSTTDGGQNWVTIDNGMWPDCKVDLIAPDLIYLTMGAEGGSFEWPHVYKSENGGFDWDRLTSSYTDGTIQDIRFPNESLGYACDYDFLRSLILKTTDAQTWDTILIQEDTTLRATHIFDESTLFFGAEYYDIYTGMEYGIFGVSYDGGATWSKHNIGESNVPTSINFIDVATGFISTEHTLLKTDNTGTDWQLIYTDSLMIIRRVYFHSNDIVFLLKSNPEMTSLMKSIDEGMNWNQISVFEDQYPRSIQFFDDYIGFILTRGDGSSFLHKTIDGGFTWTTHTLEGFSLNNFYFLDDSTGYLAGEDGIIVKTMDGGNSWHINNSVTGNDLYGVHFLDEDIGYISGSQGTILFTNTGGLVNVKEFDNNSSISHLDVWPNPCLTETTVIYTLPYLSDVRLDIINLKGQVARTFLYKNQLTGQHHTDINTKSLSPGTYLLRLSAQGIIQTKKLIIM